MLRVLRYGHVDVGADVEHDAGRPSFAPLVQQAAFHEVAVVSRLQRHMGARLGRIGRRMPVLEVERERAFPQVLDAGGHGARGEGRGRERACPQAPQAFRQYHAAQVLAAHERLRLDAGHALGDFELLEARVFEERPRAHAHRAVGRAVPLRLPVERLEHRNAVAGTLAEDSRLVDEQDLAVGAHGECRIVADRLQPGVFESLALHAHDACGYADARAGRAFGEGALSDFAKPVCQVDLGEATGNRRTPRVG